MNKIILSILIFISAVLGCKPYNDRKKDVTINSAAYDSTVIGEIKDESNYWQKQSYRDSIPKNDNLQQQKKNIHFKDDLNIVSSITKDNKTTLFKTGHSLNDYLKLEPIDEKTFKAKKNTAVEYYAYDTTEHRKKMEYLN